MRVGFYLKAVPAIFMGEIASFFAKLFKGVVFSRYEVFQLTATSETEF
jgi:hypothetical protein